MRFWVIVKSSPKTKMIKKIDKSKTVKLFKLKEIRYNSSQFIRFYFKNFDFKPSVNSDPKYIGSVIYLSLELGDLSSFPSFFCFYGQFCLPSTILFKLHQIVRKIGFVSQI